LQPESIKIHRVVANHVFFINVDVKILMRKQVS